MPTAIILTLPTVYLRFFSSNIQVVQDFVSFSFRISEDTQSLRL